MSKVIEQKFYGPDKIDIKSNELTNIIDDSLLNFKRDYILSLISNGKKAIGKQSFEKLLISCFENKHVTVDLLRSAYITDKYNNKSFSNRDKNELAKNMRHSASVANNIYNKIVPNEEVNEIPKNDELRTNIIKYLNKNSKFKPQIGTNIKYELVFDGLIWS